MISTEKPTTILYVDDDTELTTLIDTYLSGEGFELTICHDGVSGLLKALTDELFDLILLDVMLPKLDGFEVLKALRQKKTTPVILLTAKSDENDRIFGLEIGADDYLPKPFSSLELLARINALLRRVSYGQNMNVIAYITIGSMLFDNGRFRLIFNGTDVGLTSTEYSIVQLLALQRGAKVTKSVLSLKVFGRPLAQYDRSIDMHISNIRRKLQKYTSEEVIKTVRPQGYMLIDSPI